MMRRADGAIFLAIPDRNGDHDASPNAGCSFLFHRRQCRRDGQGRGFSQAGYPYAGQDGLIAGQSVGQVVSAIAQKQARSPRGAIYPRYRRSGPPAREPWTLPDLAIFIPVALIFGAVLLIYIAAAFGIKP